MEVTATSSALASRACLAGALFIPALMVLVFLGIVLVAQAFLFLERDALSLAKS